MRIMETQCDKAQCINRDARIFSIFAKRKQDGAGSMENWYHTFDLCPEDAQYFLQNILDSDELREGKLGIPDVLALLKEKNIRTRLE